MKITGLVLALILSGQTFAATDNSKLQQTKDTTSAKKSSKYSLKLEMETNSTKDGDNEFNGTETRFTVEPGYKLPNNQKIKVGADYFVRTYDKQAGDKKSTVNRKERDYINEAYVKYEYKYSQMGLPLRFQARFVYNADPIFRERYGNVANVQLRNYFGAKLGGDFVIDKYVSYVRYKQYISNRFESKLSRDYELRLRVTPAYNVNKDFKLGMTFTYNNIKHIGIDDKEEIDLGVSARYAFLKRYAVLFIADYTPLETNEFNHLAQADDAADAMTYRLNFRADL